MRDPKPLLVGELNPLGSDLRFALYPKPENGSGGRLRRILGMTSSAYLRAFRRVNLCAGEWDAREARLAASRLARETGGPFVLLGRKVSAAFGLPYAPFHTFNRFDRDATRAALVLPHPSGRCRAWNDPGAAPLARALVLDLTKRASG